MRALYAISQPGSACTERHLAPSVAVRLQQQGLVRRRHQAGHLELTDDARDALLLDPPDRSRSPDVSTLISADASTLTSLTLDRAPRGRFLTACCNFHALTGIRVMYASTIEPVVRGTSEDRA